MQELLSKSIELEKLILELKECAKVMDKNSYSFNNTMNLIQQYTLEKIRINDALNIWVQAQKK